jgi:hypothetical protein
MATDSETSLFDLSSAFEQMQAVETQLDDLAGVTAPQTGEALANAFETAGARIESALTRAARTGEINFEKMVTGILGELTRLAANAVFDQILPTGGGPATQPPPVSVTVNMPEGSDAASILSAQGQIAAALGQAVLSGGRWS